jgi:hypothetical protein
MLLFIDSCSHYVKADVTKKWSTASPAPTSADVILGGGRCGENCLELSNIVGLTKGVVKQGAAGIGTFGFAFQNTRIPQLTTMVHAESGQYIQWTARMIADGSIGVYNESLGTLQAQTAPDVLRQTVWHYVEFSFDIPNGTMVIHVDNVEVMNETGLLLHDTTHGGTDWTAMTLRSSANSTNRFGSIYITDNYDDGKTPDTTGMLGDVRVQYLRPTLDGVSSDWTVSGGGTNANAVDKNHESNLTSPAIRSSTPGDQDLNIYQAPVYTNGTCFGVQINVLGDKDTPAARTIAPLVYQGGTTAEGAETALPLGVKRYVIETMERNPVTGNGWTFGEVAGDQYGVEVKS